MKRTTRWKEETCAALQSPGSAIPLRALGETEVASTIVSDAPQHAYALSCAMCQSVNSPVDWLEYCAIGDTQMRFCNTRKGII